MRKTLALFLVIISLFILCSCGNDRDNEKLNKDDQELLNFPFTEREAKPVRSFDAEELYKHVFEEHSRELTKEEAESIVPDSKAGEAIVAFKTNNRLSLSESVVTSEKYYLVKEFTTASYNNAAKYKAAINELSPTLPLYGTVTHDYHEAYLDVLFENLSFEECGTMPDDPKIFLIGNIMTDSKVYFFYSDGYVYTYSRVANSPGDMPPASRSNKKVDIGYISAIIYSAHLDYSNKTKDHKLYINESFDTSGAKESTVTNGEATSTLYEKANGACYKITDPKWYRIVMTDETSAFWLYVQLTEVFVNEGE